METKYLLVLWPESQSFIGVEGCYLVNPMGDSDLDQAMFVPEGVYHKIMNDYDHSPIYNIGDEFFYWNFDHSKKLHIKITAIVIRKEGVYYEVEGDNWEDELSEETIKTMDYENSNTRTSN